MFQSDSYGSEPIGTKRRQGRFVGMPERIVCSYRNNPNRRSWPDSHAFAAMVRYLEDIHCFRNADSSFDVASQEGSGVRSSQKQNYRIVVLVVFLWNPIGWWM